MIDNSLAKRKGALVLFATCSKNWPALAIFSIVLLLEGCLFVKTCQARESTKEPSKQARSERSLSERESESHNNLFNYTHLLPSPFTVPAGRLVYGSVVGIGVTDFFQIQTDLIRDFYRIFNLTGKLSLIDYYGFALGVFAEASTYNLSNFSSANPDVRVFSLMPGLITAFALDDSLALFVGGNWNYTAPRTLSTGTVTSGFVRGIGLESDLSWAYNPKSGRRVGNVISTGLSYDITYRIFGVGLSHHWPGFHVGIHYYPNATRNQFLPIIAGGGSVDL